MQEGGSGLKDAAEYDRLIRVSGNVQHFEVWALHCAGQERLPSELGQLAAEQIALALANVRLREKLQDQAIRDPLTGLFNRRYFEETADQELLTAEQEGTEAGVIMIDIDHFRRFNDLNGHEAGDVVLKKVGWLLQNRIRVEDTVCRYGGEEFTVVIPQTRMESVVVRANELRKAAKELEVRSAGKLRRYSLTMAAPGGT